MQDNEKIDAFVVRNAGYYREKWKKFHEKPGSIVSFNLAACFGQVFWLAYRKLYVPLFWTVVFFIADVSLWIFVEDRQLLAEELSTAWSWFVGFLLFFVFGLLGNYWYWRKFQKVEREAAAGQADRDAQLLFLRSRGGTSPVAAWLAVVVLLMPVFWAGYWVYQANRLGIILDATGPLTLTEVQANFLNLMDKPLDGTRRECVFREVQERVRDAGDPETLDPATVELLPADAWARLDASDKRIILTQAIVTQSLIACHRSGQQKTVTAATKPDATATKVVIVAGDPRFNVFELSNAAGDGTFPSPDGTVLLSFLARDSRYCRGARFSSDYTFVLACRTDRGWEIEATSRLVPGEATNATVFGGGDMNEVNDAIRSLNPGRDLLDEREIIEAAGKGWR